MKKIASVATELDVNGFPKEAKKMDLMLLKLAQEEMEEFEHDGESDDYAKAYFKKYPDAPRTYEEAYFKKYPDAPRTYEEAYRKSRHKEESRHREEARHKKEETEQPKVNLEFQNDEELQRWMKILKGDLPFEEFNNMSPEELERHKLRMEKQRENY